MRGRKQRRRGALRTQVLRFIRRSPGSSVAHVARGLDAGWTSVKHHVRGLLLDDEIRFVRRGGRAVLVAADLTPRQAALVVPLADPEARRVLKAVARRPGARPYELARGLGSSRKVMQRYVASLVDAGLVRRSPDYHPRLSLTPSGQKANRMVR